MRSVLITGANKGIGLAVVEAILREQPDCRAILGSRNVGRGQVARDELVALNADWAERIEVLALDVSSDQNVRDGAETVASQSRGADPLYGVVNNAGAIAGSVGEVLDVNVRGIHRICDAFGPLIESGGRIVNVTSASGPNFVRHCDEERWAFFKDPAMTWERLDDFMLQCESLSDFSSLGMDSSSSYGLSKACANVYTKTLSRRFADLIVNACTPGYINTDLGRETLGGRTPEDAGMKRPADGARVIMKLLFEDVDGRGQYYGSDGLKSPLDRYRAPGDPEFEGD